MTAFIIGIVVGAVLLVVALHVWGATGDRREAVARLEAEERLRAVHLEGLRRLADAGETSLRRTTSPSSATTEPVIYAPLRALLHGSHKDGS